MGTGFAAAGALDALGVLGALPPPCPSAIDVDPAMTTLRANADEMKLRMRSSRFGLGVPTAMFAHRTAKGRGIAVPLPCPPCMARPSVVLFVNRSRPGVLERLDEACAIVSKHAELRSV